MRKGDPVAGAATLAAWDVPPRRRGFRCNRQLRPAGPPSTPAPLPPPAAQPTWMSHSASRLPTLSSESSCRTSSRDSASRSTLPSGRSGHTGSLYGAGGAAAAAAAAAVPAAAAATALDPPGAGGVVGEPGAATPPGSTW
jgi:hypothetical protein